MRGEGAMADALLRLDGICKDFGPNRVLHDIDLTVEPGSLVVLLGPAGAGKTTTLRIVAGLEAPSKGQVAILGRDITRLQPNQRNLAMIFDNLALYPNLTGFENIAFPLRTAGLGDAEVRRRVDAAAELLRIAHILDRRPSTFSGGERQRVALGRAIVREPHLYLLDEPLSSLDAMLRLDLRTELKRLQKEVGKSFLYATPDYAEALALGDRVVVLLDGRIRQVSQAQALYDAPASKDVARFVGNPPMNFWSAELLGRDDTMRIQTGSFALDVPRGITSRLDRSQDRIEVGLRPEDLKVSRASGAGFEAVVSDVEPLGMHTTLGLAMGDVRLTATVSGEDEYGVGEKVHVRIEPGKLHFFDPRTGARV
jgi:multiple sugar transport system ATP-binding protein